MENIIVIVKHPNKACEIMELAKDIKEYKRIITSSQVGEKNDSKTIVQNHSINSKIVAWADPMYFAKYPFNCDINGIKFFGSIIFTGYNIEKNEVRSLTQNEIVYIQNFDKWIMERQQKQEKAIQPLLQLAHDITCDTLAERNTSKEKLQVVVKMPNCNAFTMFLPKDKFHEAVRKFFNGNLYDASHNNVWIKQEIVHHEGNSRLLVFYNEEAYQRFDKPSLLVTPKLSENESQEEIEFFGGVIIAKAEGTEMKSLSDVEANKLAIEYTSSSRLVEVLA